MYWICIYISKNLQNVWFNICYIPWLIHMDCCQTSPGLGMETSVLNFGSITHGRIYNLSYQQMKPWINEDQNSRSREGHFFQNHRASAQAILPRFWRHDSFSFIFLYSIKSYRNRDCKHMWLLCVGGKGICFCSSSPSSNHKKIPRKALKS